MDEINILQKKRKGRIWSKVCRGFRVTRDKGQEAEKPQLSSIHHQMTHKEGWVGLVALWGENQIFVNRPTSRTNYPLLTMK